MRRLLISAFLASSLLFLAPLAAHALCTKDEECGMGQKCQLQFGRGTCVSPTPGCTTDADCTDGKTCQHVTFDKLACLAPGTITATGAPAINPDCPPGTVCLVNPLNTASIPELVGNIVKTAVGIVGALALLIFVYGGFLWLTSGGEAAKIQAGKDAMKWTAIGLAVVFSSYALVSFVLSTLSNQSR